MKVLILVVAAIVAATGIATLLGRVIPAPEVALFTGDVETDTLIQSAIDQARVGCILDAKGGATRLVYCAEKARHEVRCLRQPSAEDVAACRARWKWPGP